MKVFRLFAFFLCTALCLGFSACSNDDDDKGSSSDSLVGTWYYEEEDHHEEIEFKANGTLITNCEEYYDGEWHEWTDRGTYTYKDGVLTVYFGDEVESAEVVSISSTTLILRDEDGERMTCRRLD